MNWTLPALLLVVAFSTRQVSADCAPGTVVGPCLCMEDGAGLLALDCTNVTDGAQIAAALQEIQAEVVGSLDINNSPDLSTLPDEAFGTTAVQAIRFYNTGLSSLAATVFSSPTTESLTSLYIKHNRNFNTLESSLVSALPALQELFVSSTGLTALTDPLPATGLRYIDLTHNAISEIVDDYFAGAPELTVVLLGFNSLTSEALMGSSQTFTAPDQDLYLDLGWNSIRDGLTDIQFSLAAPRELILSGNGITNLTSGAFSPLMDLMMEQYPDTEPYILLDNNPLTCGCEVSWVVNQPNRPVLRAAQCNNGQLLDNLGPDDFSDC